MSGPALSLGVISDTHNLLRPGALRALEGCDHLVHAGDIGDESILRRLEGLAPLTVVRGNNDTAAWAASLPETCILELGGRRILVLHDLKRLTLDPAAAGLDVVIAGHSHRPRVDTIGGVLHVNPGSAGPRRFRLPVSVARLTLDGQGIQAEIVELPV